MTNDQNIKSLGQTVENSINHPAHYNTGKIEVIDFIEDQKLGFNLGNAVKYISRSAHKGTELDDLRKARWYLDREIAVLIANLIDSPTQTPGAKDPQP